MRKEAFSQKDSELITVLPQEPTPSQLVTAKMDHYGQVIALFDRKASAYAKLTLGKKSEGVIPDDEFSVLKTQAVTALDDLYTAETPKKEVSKEDETYGRLYRGLKGQIEESKANTIAKASAYTFTDKIKVTGKSVLLMAKSAHKEQQAKMLETAGYSSDMIKKLSLSTALHTTGSVAANVSLLGTSAVLGIGNPVLKDASPLQAGLAIGAVYAGAYGIGLVNAEGRMRTLKRDNIHTSSNIIATSGYLLADKVMPDKHWVKRSAVYLSSLWGMASQEPAMMLALQTPDIGPSVVFARAATLLGLGVTQRIAEEIWIKKKDSQRELRKSAD